MVLSKRREGDSKIKREDLKNKNNCWSVIVLVCLCWNWINYGSIHVTTATALPCLNLRDPPTSIKTEPSLLQSRQKTAAEPRQRALSLSIWSTFKGSTAGLIRKRRKAQQARRQHGYAPQIHLKNPGPANWPWWRTHTGKVSPIYPQRQNSAFPWCHTCGFCY